MATLAPLVYLMATAPSELKPLRVDILHLRAWVSEHSYALEAAAAESGREALGRAASTQTHLAYALILTLGIFCFWRGFVSTRARGWNHFFWVTGACLVFFAPAFVPDLTPQKLDYLSTFWFGLERPPGSAGLGGGRSAGHLRTALPETLMFFRAVLAALSGAFVALCLHDTGYRLREALTEFGFLPEEEKEGRRSYAAYEYGSAGARQHAGRAGAAAGAAEDAAHAFGHRDSSRRPAPIDSAEARACATLGVRLGAGRKEIERAYRTKMKSAHPDHGGSVERAAALNMARDILLPHG